MIERTAAAPVKEDGKRSEQTQDGKVEERGMGKTIFQIPTPSRGITMPFINAMFADKYEMRPLQGRQSIPFLFG